MSDRPASTAPWDQPRQGQVFTARVRSAAAAERKIRRKLRGATDLQIDEVRMGRDGQWIVHASWKRVYRDPLVDELQSAADSAMDLGLLGSPEEQAAALRASSGLLREAAETIEERDIALAERAVP